MITTGFDTTSSPLASLSGSSAVSRLTNSGNSRLSGWFERTFDPQGFNAKFNAQQAELERAFSADQAVKSFEREASEAQKARDWSERMSNTEVQRRLEDYRKAGLNPYLAYGSSASTPASPVARSTSARGASASVGGSGNFQVLADIFGSALSAVKLSQMAHLRSLELALAQREVRTDWFDKFGNNAGYQVVRKR